MSDNFTLLRPATLDLAEHVGRSIADPDITPERRAMLVRIFFAMTPEAQHRASVVSAHCHAALVAALPTCRLVIDNTHGGDNA
jgi:hypothetical protein